MRLGGAEAERCYGSMRIAAQRGKSCSSSAALAFDPRTFLTWIEHGKTTREYQGRQVVFSQGDAADAVFYIQSGKVKLTVVSTRGKEAVDRRSGARQLLRRGLPGGPTPAHVHRRARFRPSSIVRVDKSTMVSLLHQEPEFAELFTAYLLSRNVRIEEDLVDQLFNSSEKRLARILLLLAHFGKESRPESVIPKVSQETLAAMVRHDAFAGELLHESLQEDGLHPLQRRPAGPQRPAHGRASRLKSARGRWSRRAGEVGGRALIASARKWGRDDRRRPNRGGLERRQPRAIAVAAALAHAV